MKHSYADRDIVYELMSGFDVQAMLSEDAYNDEHFLENPGPWRFGYNYFVNYNLNNSGVWTILDNGDRLWRLGVVCPGALTINLAFQYVSIPEGAKLFVYNGRKTESLGSFSQRYVSEDHYLATELLSGDSIVVEYMVPASAENRGSLELFRVTHGYRSAVEYAEKAFGSSGSCNMNVNCPDGQIWSDQKRSVVMLVSGGSGFCSGSIINNSCNDGIPYLLTANHCGSSGFSTWTFRFNWEAPTCSNPGSSPSFVSLSGATSRANRSQADMRLLELNSAIPLGYNVYYSGWNRSNTPPSSGFGIHHPAGDIKKISFDDNPFNVITAMGGETNCCWEVVWDRNTTTEGGSSGSPLFDNNGRIVGQLWGGSASCSNQSGSDYYGRIYQNWNPPSSPNSGQLQYWLDPTSCTTGALYINGYDPNMPVVALDAQISSITQPASTLCSGSNITPVATLKNSGTTTLTSATISYQVDAGAPVNYTWTGSLASTGSTNVSLSPFTVGAGSHTITVTVSNPNGGSDMNNSNDSKTANFTVVNPTGLALPFSEGFDGVTFPPANWINENPDNNTGSALWVRTTVVSGFGNSSACAKIDQLSPSSSTNGQVDNLITPYLDLTSTTTPITLSFSVANARYNSNFYDSLIVYISTNCGGTWSHLAAYGNNTGPSPLATAPDVTSLFTPTNSQWATKTINLNAYASMSAVQIRFQLRSGWGNVTYLDDINIAGGAVPPPVASFSSSSNTICAGQNINFTNTSTGATSYSWSMPGGTPSSSTATNPSVVYNSAGTYTVTLTATNNSGTSTSTATFTVKANPNAVATNNGAICQGSSATLTAVGGGTYSWSNGSTSATTNVSPIVNTSYTVTVTASNGCTATSSTTVTVLDCSSIDDVLQADNMLFFPNPAHTTIQLDLSSVSNETLTVDWLTPIGQLMQTYFIQPYQTSIVMHVDHLAAGIYLVRITDGTRSITRRIMIIK